MEHISLWSVLKTLLYSAKTKKTMKRNTETQLHVRNKVGLKLNAEKTKYIFMSRHPNYRHKDS